jgi:hypothetical protein
MPLLLGIFISVLIPSSGWARGLTVVSAQGDSALSQVLEHRHGGDRLERTESLIAERNHQAMAQLKKFYSQGWAAQEQIPWQETHVPHQGIIWNELRLATTDVPARELDQVARVFRNSSDQRLRILAIEAIGRSTETRAQELLVDLYRNSESESERQQILSFVNPSSTKDPIAEFLMEEVLNKSRPLAIRKQAAMILVVAFLPEEAKQGRSLATLQSDSTWSKLYQVIWGGSP